MSVAKGNCSLLQHDREVQSSTRLAQGCCNATQSFLDTLWPLPRLVESKLCRRIEIGLSQMDSAWIAGKADLVPAIALLESAKVINTGIV